MTDEEMAVQYASNYNLMNKDLSPKSPWHIVTEVFLAGLEAGRPKWHKPEETIEKNKIVLGHIKHCNKDRYSLVQWNGEWWYQYGTYNAEVRLIAWGEIPKFEEK